jgi:medium-chain acyl-[acyl-carrier-protein] hydrolase
VPARAIGNLRWLRCPRRDESAHLRLLCFHYAGGNAAIFRDWPRLLPSAIEPIAVQLPGRTDRVAEPPYTDMDTLVAELIEVIMPLLGQPVACYGASMGARVAWALAHALRDRGLPLPAKLYVASSTAPSLELPVRGWNEPDSGLIDYMRDLGGTPEAILADREWLSQLLPTLRADLTVLGTHALRPARPLNIPVHAFSGVDDVEASPDLMSGWQAETAAGFWLDAIPGGHFFSREGQQRVIDVISADLSYARKTRAPTGGCDAR